MSDNTCLVTRNREKTELLVLFDISLLISNHHCKETPQDARESHQGDVLPKSFADDFFLTGGHFCGMALTVAARLLLSITATRRTDELMTRIVVVTTLSVCLFYILKEKRIDLTIVIAGWLVLIMVTYFLTVINHTFGSPLSSDVPNIYKRNYFYLNRDCVGKDTIFMHVHSHALNTTHKLQFHHYLH